MHVMLENGNPPFSFKFCAILKPFLVFLYLCCGMVCIRNCPSLILTSFSLLKSQDALKQNNDNNVCLILNAL